MEEINNRYTQEQWVEHYQKNYIDALTLDTATQIIKSDMTNMARTCVSIGFHLKAVRDRELFHEAGYENLWEYAADQFGLSLSSASRYIAINDQFSVGGNTPQLQEEYRNFSKSQLQEMITMSDDQKRQVTEKMTVKQIRKIKNPDPEIQEKTDLEEEQIEGQMSIEDYENDGVDEHEKSVATSQKAEERSEESSCLPKINQCIRQELSVYGLPLRKYPEDSLIKTGGCGTHDCFSCHQSSCGIRQEFCHCVEAPCGSPFPCEMLDQISVIRESLSAGCQFLDCSLAYHRDGDGEPVPCCKDCENLCEYACSRVRKALERLGGTVAEQSDSSVNNPTQVLEGEFREVEELEKEELFEGATDGSDLEIVRTMLEEEKAELEEFIKVDKVDKLPEKLMRKKRLMVSALAGMLRNLEMTDNPPGELEQPELPVMKNNDQRREWLRNYNDWGLWYEDEHIGVKYYRYEFENGAVLIVDEYKQQNEYAGEFVSSFYHLVGGPEPPKGSCGFGKWTRHEKYNRYPNSETELVEFLKEVQKCGKK